MNTDKTYQENDLISVVQAAEILGISRVAVLKRIKKDQLEARKVGRNYVICYGDLAGRFTSKDKAMANAAVKKAVREYGEVFKKLGKE